MSFRLLCKCILTLAGKEGFEHEADPAYDNKQDDAEKSESRTPESERQTGEHKHQDASDCKQKGQ